MRTVANQTSTGIIPGSVVILMKGALRDMLLTQLKKAAAALLILGGIATGAAALTQQAAEPTPGEAKKPSTSRSVLEERKDGLSQVVEINGLRNEIGMLTVALSSFQIDLERHDPAKLNSPVPPELLAKIQREASDLARKMEAVSGQVQKTVEGLRPDSHLVRGHKRPGGEPTTHRIQDGGQSASERRLGEIEKKLDQVLKALEDNQGDSH